MKTKDLVIASNELSLIYTNINEGDPITMKFEGRLPTLNEILYMSRSSFGSPYSKIKKNYSGSMKAFLNEAIGKLSLTVRENLPIKEESDIHFYWIMGSTKRDPDNVSVGAKFLLDGLVSCGVIKDDSFKYIRSIQHYFCKNCSTKKDNVLILIDECNNGFFSKGKERNEKQNCKNVNNGADIGTSWGGAFNSC